MPKKEEVSLEEAAQAFIALHDSGNYNGRRYDRVLGFLRDAVKKDGKSKTGPIVPDYDEMRPELTEEQQFYADENIWTGARVHDLIHPGGRLQDAREAIDTIIKKAEEGTLAEDGARRMAADIQEKAKETGMKTAAEEQGADKKGAAQKEKAAEKVAERRAANQYAQPRPTTGTTATTKGS